VSPPRSTHRENRRCKRAVSRPCKSDFNLIITNSWSLVLFRVLRQRLAREVFIAEIEIAATRLLTISSAAANHWVCLRRGTLWQKSLFNSVVFASRAQTLPAKLLDQDQTLTDQCQIGLTALGNNAPGNQNLATLAPCVDFSAGLVWGLFLDLTFRRTVTVPSSRFFFTSQLQLRISKSERTNRHHCCRHHCKLYILPFCCYWTRDRRQEPTNRVEISAKV
jgi:hypothetical protein